MALWVARLARPLEMLLGAYFIWTALLKAQDIQLFTAQIYAYQVVHARGGLIAAALTTVTLEAFLGSALLLGARLRYLPHVLIQGMLVFFTGLIIYAWQVHNITDCGCFGSIKVTPQQGITKNLFTMLLAGLAWYGVSRPGAATESPMRRVADLRIVVPITTAIAVLLFAAGGLQSTTPAPKPETPVTVNDAPAPPAAAGPFAQFSFTSEMGETFNLAQGEYLVAMLSMTCEHCMATVPALNDLALGGDLPPLVALCFEPAEGDLDNFKLETGAAFPLHNLGDNFLTFSEFIGKEPPRLAYVRDGKAIQFWDGDPPTREVITTAIGEARSTHAAATATH